MILLLGWFLIILKRPWTTYLRFLPIITIQGGARWKKSSETLKQSYWKIPKKNLSKVSSLKKWIHSRAFFNMFSKSLSNLIHDFRKDCFPKPKLLLAANKLIYLNISIGLSNIFKVPAPLARYSFSDRATTFRVKIRSALEENSWYLFLETSLYSDNKYSR